MRKTSMKGKKMVHFESKRVNDSETLKINHKKNAVIDFNTEEF